MIEATEDAMQELKKLLRASTDEPEACIRLTANIEGNFALVVDMEREGDHVIEHEESKVLLVERGLADTLARTGITIYVEETSEGAKLAVFRVPY